MGLFDKKYCDICGEKISFLGNRKLSDGNMCKKCAEKLSPFFSERRESTIEQIKEQLAYRENNKTEVENFHVSKMWGKSRYLFIDEEKGNFIVNFTKDHKEDNPDVIPISAITGITVDVTENRTEKKTQDKDGKFISYRPPRFDNYYAVYFKITVNHPYFDEIEFKISDDITIPSVGSEKVDPSMSVQYREAILMADEMKNALQSTAKPKQPVKCPACGATTVPDAKGCCEYCGSALN